jgi:DNA-binding response OmpR family regulator
VILVYSAMPTQESESKALHLGANAYLKKPGTIEILVETVSRLVK